MLKHALRAAIISLALLPAATAAAGPIIGPSPLFEHAHQGLTPNEGVVLAQAGGDAVVISADDTSVDVPWGDWVVTALTAVETVLYAAIEEGWKAMLIFLGTVVPASVWTILRPMVLTWRVEQLLVRTAQTAIAKTKGALPGKSVSVTIMNDMLREAARLAITNGAPVVIAYAASTAAELADKLLARFAEQGVVPESYDAAQAQMSVARGMADAGKADI